MRPLWKGSISFGLVNIPVGLYSAINRQKTIDLDMLRDSDHSRIRYRKVAEADGKEVPLEHIVKGYEYEKGNYVVITPEDFQRVQIKSNQTVDIREFVKAGEIDPRFLDQPYYLAPEKNGAKAYVLLKTALEKTGLAGIAKVVIRPPREHLALLQPLDGLLMMETLHFADELRDTAELPKPHADIGQKELDMAISLVNTMAGQWDPTQFHDEYRESLMELIEQKIKAGGKRMPVAKGQPKAPEKVIDLVGLLQESLGHTHKKKTRPARHHRKTLKKAA
jgi:DNA end-binding protein Ku